MIFEVCVAFISGRLSIITEIHPGKGLKSRIDHRGRKFDVVSQTWRQ